MKQTCNTRSEQEIAALIDGLRSRDAVTRDQARKRLATIGRPATSGLTELLKDSEQHVRWEAARTLGDIADPEAAAEAVLKQCTRSE